MSDLLEAIKELVQKGTVRISDHGYDELAADDIFVRDVVAELVEEYLDYPKGPCVLVLEYDSDGRPVHAVWGIPRGAMEPAVLITAYRPDAGRWKDDFRSRK